MNMCQLLKAGAPSPGTALRTFRGDTKEIAITASASGEWGCLQGIRDPHQKGNRKVGTAETAKISLHILATTHYCSLISHS